MFHLSKASKKSPKRSSIQKDLWKNNPKVDLNVIQKIITNLLTDRLTWQNFFLNSHLRLVNNCLESIYKTQKTKMNVLPCETIDEYMICI